MTGWEKLWQDPEVVKLWEEFPPLPQVTALAACRENLVKAGLRAVVVAVEMSEIPFPNGYFDGIVASHSIHHVDGPTLRRIIGLVTCKLAADGLLVWATPSTRHWCCGLGREIDPGTWVDENHREGPIPHHYCTEEEIRGLLSGYEIESLVEHEYREGERSHWHWRLIARKRGS